MVLASAWLFSLAWPAYGFAFIARSVRMFDSATGLVFGVTPDVRALSLIPWLLAPPAGIIIGGRYWPGGGVGGVRAGGCCCRPTAAFAILTIVFLVRWNYLPATF